jgi:hypothetical protein
VRDHQARGRRRPSRCARGATSGRRAETVARGAARHAR